MSLYEQLLLGLNRQPQYVNFVISFFDLPDDLSAILAQIRWHEDYQLIKGQVQISMPHQPNHSTASTSAPPAMSPSKSTKTPVQYRCSQYACRSLPPYKTLGHFRNHMSVKHNEKEVDCSVYQVVDASVGAASVGAASVCNHSEGFTTPDSQSRMIPAPSFHHTHGRSEKSLIINAPLPKTPFHNHLNNNTAPGAMPTFAQIQNEFNGAYTQPHTATPTRWTQ